MCARKGNTKKRANKRDRNKRTNRRTDCPNVSKMNNEFLSKLKETEGRQKETTKKETKRD